jgi:hypothetical protein
MDKTKRQKVIIKDKEQETDQEKRAKLIDCFVNEVPLEEIIKTYGFTVRQINRLKKHKTFEQEIKERRRSALLATQDPAHIYIKKSQEALYTLMNTTKDERIKMDAARYLLKEVRDNIDMMSTLHTRNEIEQIKEELNILNKQDGE